MRSVLRRPVRLALVLGLVVVIASMSAVFRVGGSVAASAPTITVTCESGVFGRAKAVFSWSGANGIGSVHLFPGGLNDVILDTSQKSGTIAVEALAEGPSVYASAELLSAPDKTGAVTRLAIEFTPEDGCPYS